MTFVFLGIGSNIEDPLTQLNNAITAIQTIPLTSLIHISSFYKSKPVGPQNQPDFINAVLCIDTKLYPDKLLDYVQEIEVKQGRTRDLRWGPRTIDVDILVFGDEIIETARLVVPHPELHKRAFVLQPLFEIAPELLIPGRGLVKDLLRYVNTDNSNKLS